LNPEGNTFTLQLADRIHEFNNRQREDRKVTWFGANYLLNFSLDEYERLYQSGFTGGWFDISALDDENARAMRTPYWNKSLIPNLKTYVQALGVQNAQHQSKDKSEADIPDSKAAEDQLQEIRWTMFLGNPSTTLYTIRKTLQIANTEGLAQLFRDCYIISNIRVFDYEGPDEDTVAVTYSVTPALKRVGYKQILPSFAYSPALLAHFGSKEEIDLMFDYLEETFLSTQYQETRNWVDFINNHATPASIVNWVVELSAAKQIDLPAVTGIILDGNVPENLKKLFQENPSADEQDELENLAKQWVESLLCACLTVFATTFESLGFPSSMDALERMTPYAMAKGIFGRWSTQDELLEECTKQAGSDLTTLRRDFLNFCVKAVLYRMNIKIKPKFRELFFSK
jgi:hypothetical protein